MINYGWQIDKDHLDEDGLRNDIGVTGPSTIPDNLLVMLNNEYGHKFKIYDDDGELYYSGRFLFDEDGGEVKTVDKINDLPEEAFGPLWDFAEPNAGAVTIKYLFNGSYVTL